MIQFNKLLFNLQIIHLNNKLFAMSVNWQTGITAPMNPQLGVQRLKKCCHYISNHMNVNT